MEVQYRGANCVRITTKSAVITTDPLVPGVKVKTDKVTTVLVTQPMLLGERPEQAFVVETPGEYEISGVSIKGIAARAHMDGEGRHTATMYRLITDDASVLLVGHIYPKLSDDDLEAIGTIDILILPVGGNGYTLDATGAAAIVRAIEPKLIIPTHYADSEVNYEVPQAELKVFLDELGAQEPGAVDKWKLKGDLPENMTICVLNRTA